VPSAGAVGTAGDSSAHRIHPGVVVKIAGVDCKAGVLLHRGKTVFVGVPGSCAGGDLDVGKKQDGCAAATAPAGTPVQVAGQRHRSLLVYNSFTRMQGEGVTNRRKCQYNDLALVQLSPADGKAASAKIPGSVAPNSVRQHPPASGTHVMLGASGATTAGATNHGWVYPLSNSPAVGATDVGTPVVHRHQLVGLLTIVPSGVVARTSAAAYNLHRAMTFLHRVPGFHHVKLLP
jgi:hypothetical protein